MSGCTLNFIYMKKKWKKSNLRNDKPEINFN